MKMKMQSLAFLAVMLIISAVAQNASAQKTDKKNDASKKKTQSFVLKSTKIEAGRGAADDANIKNDSDKNTQDQEFPAPKEKTGNTRGGGGVCRVVLDNQTKLRIKIYVDGTLRGTIAPYGDSETYTEAGPTRVYARAEFEDGSALTWGPSNYDCYAGQYINFKMGY